MKKKLKNLVDNYNLYKRENVVKFIKENPERLTLNVLLELAEFTNTQKSETAAYYTEKETLAQIEKFLPEINKKVIHVLEPSAGAGNFLDIIINKYSNAEKLIIDLNDIDKISIEIIKNLNKHRNIPENVEINYFNHDYLTYDFNKEYDLIIGNPPFLKLSKKTGLDIYSSIFNDNKTKNIAGFFLEKSVNMSENIALILPKYFLHNNDFAYIRDLVKKFNISNIIDFGETGFKGVLIETIAIFINTCEKPNETIVYSVPRNYQNKEKQEIITSDEFPSWIIYRNDFFNEIASKMYLNIFKSFRDRQITNKILKNDGDVRVIKSRNINREGTKIINITNYDSYINTEDLNKLSITKYLKKDDVYLCPNMTYYPRVIKKPKNVVVNGSVAILENKSSFKINDKDLRFFSSPTFEEFYRIARNYSTRSLNIDSNSVVFFGLLKENR